MADNILHLDIWPGEWDLPSVDHNCLAALAYCRFSGVPVKVKKARNPWSSPNGNFPVMRHNDVKETDVNNIFNYLRKQNWGIDSNLSRKQCADVVAFTAMMNNRLLPALLHQLWIDNDTYSNVTGPWFTRTAAFPYKFWLASRLHKEALKKVYEPHSMANVTNENIDAKIYREAKDCLTYLSQKLGDQDYFFGSTPSSLDALVFSYTAPLLKAPLNSNPLTNHLHGFTENLCLHTRRILREFFPPTQEEIEAKQKEEANRKAAEAESAENRTRNRDMIITGAFAVMSMAVFVSVNRLLDLSVFERVLGTNDTLDGDI
ncbi:MTX1-like protein [Mya arenaria]|uniref:MTX1-like protein n=1 Tax=Mya arenaria TaxID=6604 RepID=A0ABY7DKA3_MYAAR|nr:metaxin-1-like [Mya arenaria]WAQ97779.1 MTX1-like protein [Mya arenaria]